MKLYDILCCGLYLAECSETSFHHFWKDSGEGGGSNHGCGKMTVAGNLFIWAMYMTRENEWYLRENNACRERWIEVSLCNKNVIMPLCNVKCVLLSRSLNNRFLCAVNWCEDAKYQVTHLEDAGRMFAWCAAALVATFPTLSAVTVNEVYSGKSAEVITARVDNICVKAIRFPLCKAYIQTASVV
jgi:hypothetical protein